ncbi:MAG: hypothetical protein U0V87_11400 [Acidobacteriota bacterium]
MKRRLWSLALAAVLTLGTLACTPPKRPGDEQILEAGSEPEREALRERREELEQDFDAVLQAKQDEIDKLKQENKELKKRLGL